MNFVYFCLGLIIGILIRDIKYEVVNKTQELKKTFESKGETQFLDPVTTAEKFKEAKSIDDIIENF